MTPPERWTIADVVDLEYFLSVEGLSAKGTGPDAAGEAMQTDRRTLAVGDRRTVLRGWLEQTRRRRDLHPSPGESVMATQSLLNLLAWLTGAVVGGALSGAWLIAGARGPVNAPLFWMSTVGIQLALLAIALVGWLLRRRAGAGIAAAGVLARGVVRALIWRSGAALAGMGGERRAALQAALGRMATRGSGHGELLALPALAWTQRFAVAFNLSLLATMLAVHLPLVEVRFGWQSTYPASAAQAHRVVSWIATPWRWALPQALPSLDELGATRIRGTADEAGFDADASRAWWPFLAMSVLCYGALLRLALLAWVSWAQRRRLAMLRLDQPEAQALYRRLTGPLVQAQPNETRLPELAPGSANVQVRRGGRCVALVATELERSDAVVVDALGRRFGWDAQVHRTSIDDRRAAAALLESLRKAGGEIYDAPAAIAVVTEARRDPIVAIAQFLRTVREATDPDAEMVVLLAAASDPAVAAPAADGQAATDARLVVWRRFMQIHRLAIGVEVLP